MLDGSGAILLLLDTPNACNLSGLCIVGWERRSPAVPYAQCVRRCLCFVLLADRAALSSCPIRPVRKALSVFCTAGKERRSPSPILPVCVSLSGFCFVGWERRAPAVPYAQCVRRCLCFVLLAESGVLLARYSQCVRRSLVGFVLLAVREWRAPAARYSPVVWRCCRGC